jgi:hypothetical protein
MFLTITIAFGTLGRNLQCAYLSIDVPNYSTKVLEIILKYWFNIFP